MSARRSGRSKILSIGISAGGAAAHDLNVVIRAVVKTALNLGAKVVDVRRGRHADHRQVTGRYG